MTQRTEILTARLRAHDGLMSASDLNPTEQVSVCMVLTILALRRAFRQLGIDGPGHGAKRKALRNAMEKDFASKLRQYTMPAIDNANAAEEEPTIEPLPGLGG